MIYHIVKSQILYIAYHPSLSHIDFGKQLVKDEKARRAAEGKVDVFLVLLPPISAEQHVNLQSCYSL